MIIGILAVLNKLFIWDALNLGGAFLSKMSKLWVKFGESNAVKVSTNGCLDVDDFIKAVKKELQIPNPPQEISISFTMGGKAWQPDLKLDQLSTLPGFTENNYGHPLLISVKLAESESRIGSRSASGSSLNAPHPKRKERWEQINAILGKNKKRSTAIDSTGYSYVKWSEVKIVFKTTPYVQSLKAIPDREFSILSQYLSFATKCFGPITSGNESQRLHLIAPIIICVCILFNGDVQIKVEEDLFGDYLKAHGHFEFVLCRGNKRVCIVEAKKDDMEQGMAQDLLGCEVAAELDHSDSVFGIVTNYIQWNFLRSLDEKIEMEECAMDITGDGPVQASLLKITSKIYAMLSDD